MAAPAPCPSHVGRVFDTYAQGGGLDGFGLKCALLAAVGYKPTKVELGQVRQKARERGERCVDRATFTEHVLERHRAMDPEEWIRAAFRCLDDAQSGFLERRRLLALSSSHAGQPGGVGALADALDALAPSSDGDVPGRLSARAATGALRAALGRRHA